MSAPIYASTGDTIEAEFIAAVQTMLGRPDYLIPLAAAERQFRDHYYGLNSAALLEDLFFDALGNFLRQTRPDIDLTRPPTGQKGWDYSFEGLHISHKVSQRLGQIAALWDATKRGITHWSFLEPIVYVLGQNSPSTSVLASIQEGPPFKCRALADLGKPYALDGRALLIVRWAPGGGQPELLEVVVPEPDATAKEVLPFSRIWRHLARHVASGGAANDIDVLVTSRQPNAALTTSLKSIAQPAEIDLSVNLRGGVYLLPRDLLQNLQVTTNNRAVLIPQKTVEACLHQAALRGFYAPLPVWYWVYAEERPPDMYSAQRIEYETRFSARGELDID